MSVYVRAGDEYTISGLTDGTYRSYFTDGEDWDEKHRTFTRRCTFSKGGKSELTSSATTYTVASFSIFSNAPRGKRAPLVDPGKFPGGPK
jgi:hypothetical protein